MTNVSQQSTTMPRPLRRLYQWTSIIWAIYATALALTIYGSTLLAFAQPARGVLAALATVVGLGMVVRAVVPGRPEWTRWTLPLILGTSVATFSLLLFAADIAGGFTPIRVGLSLLVLTPAGFSYVHYLGEKVVAPR